MKRVLIVENETILGAGVQGLLSSQTDLDVIGISPRDELDLIQEIRRVRPDVVFLDKDSCVSDPADLLGFLEDYPKLRLVVVSANDNFVHIYDVQKTLLDQVTDLLGIIAENRLSERQTL